MRVRNLKTYHIELSQAHSKEELQFNLVWNGWQFTGTKQEVLEQLESIINELEES